MLTRKNVHSIEGVDAERYAAILDDMFSNPLEEWRHAANHELAADRLLISSACGPDIPGPAAKWSEAGCCKTQEWKPGRPSLRRRVLAAINGDLDPIEVLKELDMRIRTSIPVRSDAQ